MDWDAQGALLESVMTAQLKKAPVTVMVCPEITGPDADGSYAIGKSFMLYIAQTMGNPVRVDLLAVAAHALEGVLEDVRQQMRDLE